MNWKDFAAKYNIQNPLEFQSDLTKLRSPATEAAGEGEPDDWYPTEEDARWFLRSMGYGNNGITSTELFIAKESFKRVKYWQQKAQQLSASQPVQGSLQQNKGGAE